MTERLLFAAGDVGGAPVVLPVAGCAAAEDFAAVSVLAHGALHGEGDPSWTWLADAEACALRPNALICATSVIDPLEHVPGSLIQKGFPSPRRCDSLAKSEGQRHGQGILGGSAGTGHRRGGGGQFRAIGGGAVRCRSGDGDPTGAAAPGDGRADGAASGAPAPLEARPARDVPDGMIEETVDITLAEMRARLAASD